MNAAPVGRETVRFSAVAGVAGVFGFDDGLCVVPVPEGGSVVSGGGMVASGGMVMAVVSMDEPPYKLSTADVEVSSFLEQADRDTARVRTSRNAPAARIAFITTSSVVFGR
jgi:hypothetical protein